MILCDIGNTHYHFFFNNQELKLSVDQIPVLQKNDILPTDYIYYISVNEIAANVLKDNNLCIDLSQYIQSNTEYDIEQIGIDRLFACLGIKDGVVIDAGSAITIDIIEDNKHLGGYILPGIMAYKDAYASISKVLDKPFNFAVDKDILPLNTVDSMSGGMIASVTRLVDSVSKGKTIYTLGGDGKFFSRFFENSIYDKNLIFKGMEKVIKDNNLIEDFKI
jgi:type III pantothenate kinase